MNQATGSKSKRNHRTMDEESELGDFDPQNDSEEQNSDEYPTEEMQVQPPTLAQVRLEASDYDRQIRPGDVVRDLWGGGWMIIFQRKADTVTEYDRMQDDTKKSLLAYEGNKAMGATEEDTVWQCFYLNKNNTLAGGRSGPYSFPESRICRYAYEATDGWKAGRFQDHIQMQVLERLATTALEHETEEVIDGLETLMKNVFGVDQAQEAFELAEASVGGDPRA